MVTVEGRCYNMLCTCSYPKLLPSPITQLEMFSMLSLGNCKANPNMFKASVGLKQLWN